MFPNKHTHTHTCRHSNAADNATATSFQTQHELVGAVYFARVCVVCYILHTLTLVQRDNDAHISHIHICTAQCLRMYVGCIWCLSVFGFRRLSDLYKIVGTSRRAVSSQWKPSTTRCLSGMQRSWKTYKLATAWRAILEVLQVRWELEWTRIRRSCLKPLEAVYLTEDSALRRSKRNS